MNPWSSSFLVCVALSVGCGADSTKDTTPAGGTGGSGGASVGAAGSGAVATSVGGGGVLDAAAGAGGQRGEEGGTLDAPVDGTAFDATGTDGDGDFTIGPNYMDAPEIAVRQGIPKGKVYNFTMDSHVSKIYPGTDPSLTSPAPFSRGVWVYVPNQLTGAELPFIVVQDGGSYVGRMQTVLDNLINDHKLPAMVAVLINPGPGDGRGSERGLEYDTVSDAYVNFIETEALPAVLQNPQIHAAYPALKLTADPEGRATMGCSSGGAAAFTMGWFRPDLYRRILTYSGTFVNQHPDATYPHSAWSYHEFLIENTSKKPLRVFLEVGENDNNLDADPRFNNDMMHNWITANRQMAAALKSKAYHYRFLFANGASHCDSRVQAQTLPETLQWLWRGYPIQP
jgi:enterochelin esterase family protein